MEKALAGDTCFQVCAHQLFEAQVERTPHAIAAVCGSEHVTYQDLNRRANRLAHYLRILGVRPEMPIGICIERSLDMLVGVIAICKAGGPMFPWSRPTQKTALHLCSPMPGYPSC
jgi:non-ribosomal peptide synthetase component F